MEADQYTPVTYDCDCPGGRQFEPLDEPPVENKVWHVCPCCGKRVLLPRRWK